MTRNQIFKELQEIFYDVFDYDIELDSETRREDIPEWDSLHTIMILSAIENEFHIHFNIQDVEELNTINDIINIIELKLK